MNLPIRKPFIIAGVFMLGLSLVWTVHLGKPWTRRIPPGWSETAQYVGTQTWADPVTGRLPEQDALADYERSIRVMSQELNGESVILEDRMTLRDIDTDSITWEYFTRLPVDARTGAHLTPAYEGEVALFPRRVERRTYRLRGNYLEGVPLAFEREEEIQGLSTFLFAYKGPVSYTDSYRGTEQYPGVPIGDGQEIRCADDQFYYRAWVEPVTGSLVKVEEGCPSADNIYVAGSDSVVSTISRWTGVTAGDGLLRRVDEVGSLRRAFLFASRYLPITLAMTGLVLLGVGAAGTRATRTTPATP